MSDGSPNNGSDPPLKLEVEMKRDGTVRMVFPSLNDETLIELMRSIPQLKGDIATADKGPDTCEEEVRARVPRLFQTKSRKLEERISSIEEKMSKLVEITENLAGSLETSGKGNGDDVRVPSNGTKYNRVLRDMALEFGGGEFDSTSVPESERHILSILNNRYNALDVVDNRGRTNIYRVREQVIRKIFSEEGECINIEIRGKPREVVERTLKSNKDNYPKFSYMLKEGAAQRQVYTLIFGDPSVKVSVMENLSRSIGNHRNMKIYST
jgi:hypothetical protein